MATTLELLGCQVKITGHQGRPGVVPTVLAKMTANHAQVRLGLPLQTQKPNPTDLNRIWQWLERGADGAWGAGARRRRAGLRGDLWALRRGVRRAVELGLRSFLFGGEVRACVAFGLAASACCAGWRTLPARESAR